ncbi:MAG TPA: DUF488 domain-containing protein [Xanthobacteraceae bacterium]|nr:DUF488 domain-containing protein [Xanthobacteraceae bacterium]
MKSPSLASQTSAMAAFDLTTIGHSNIPAERFVALLQDAGVNMIVDVRSLPFSRRFPWFSAKTLAGSLARAGIAYVPMGETLGGRPRDDSLYRDGIADYGAMAVRPEYLASLDRLIAAAARSRVCVMCAEREPLDCHRCLLIARSLAERGLAVGHIRHDGTTEPHAVTEKRLLALEADAAEPFAALQRERLAAAYRSRARAVAFRQEVPAPRGAAENG